MTQVRKLPTSKVDIAIVGCGAIAEHQHLRLLTRRDDCRITALVDTNREQAERLSKRFAVPNVLTDYRELLTLGVDAAIVALPNHLHAAVAVPLLTAGIHVLVEKPMARTVRECDAMLAAAEAGQAILSVGLMRRFSHAGQFAKWAIDNGVLGAITSFDIRDGFIFTWPIASDFLLRRDLAGGGVLMDLGSHTLDQLLWWFGDVGSLEYYDDSFGGVEADCLIRVKHTSGIEGTIELSRTRDLGARAVIRGTQAQLELELVRNSLSLRFPEAPIEVTGAARFPGKPLLSDQKAGDLIAAQHDDFLGAIQSGRAPMIPGAEGRLSVALIESCYRQRQPLALPWVESRSQPLPKLLIKDAV